MHTIKENTIADHIKMKRSAQSEIMYINPFQKHDATSKYKKNRTFRNPQYNFAHIAVCK